MRVLALTRYSANGASSRMRTFQYLPALKRAGIDVEVSPLLNNDYLHALYSKRRALGAIVKGYLGRLWALCKASKFDVIWVEKEAFPWVPAFIELSLLRGRKVVVDYDDALFHRYDDHKSRIIRMVLGRKIDKVMKRANLVLVGNDYLGKRARAAGARKIEYLPTVVDLSRYDLAKSRNRDRQIVIGWIGSPSTAKYLNVVSVVLKSLQTRYPIRCVAIGAREDQLVGTPFEALSWSLDDEVNSIRGLDIGIMPLIDGYFERGKCGYKLIQYMACGLPVIASPVGVNCQIVMQGGSGFLANAEEDWRAALENLIGDEELRSRMGREGRRRVEGIYSLQIQAPKLIHYLSELFPA